MKTETAANILGALAQAVTDAVSDAIVEDRGCSESSAAALVHLAKYRDETIDALRRPLGLSHPGCVRLIDRLEETELVARGEGSDRRTRALRLTRTGKAEARALLRARGEVLAEVIAVLSAAERRTFARLASKILGSLVEDVDDGLAVCRLCDYESCPDEDCPVSKTLQPRAGSAS